MLTFKHNKIKFNYPIASVTLELKMRNFTKCLKNQPCDVIKIREIRGEVGKKIP